MKELNLNPVYKRAPELYLSPDMNAPLAEQANNVLQLEQTTGCSHNACSYCDLFREEKYKVVSPENFKEHVSEVFETLQERREISQLERIFIGNGDALSTETRELQGNIDYAIKTFRQHTGKNPKRVAMFASIRNVLTKTTEELRDLHCGGYCGDCSKRKHGTRIGLELIYLGLETGDETLLRDIGKGHTVEEMYEAFKRIRAVTTGGGFTGQHSKLRVSAFVMPGLGGVKHSENHVKNTLEALNYLKPEFINLMTISEQPGTKYARDMEQAKFKGTNRSLTSQETVEQIADFVKGLDFPTMIGCFDNSSYLGKDTNAVKFPSVKLNWLELSTLSEQLRTAATNGETEITDPGKVKPQHSFW